MYYCRNLINSGVVARLFSLFRLTECDSRNRQQIHSCETLCTVIFKIMFEKMTKEEALEYCYKHANEFKAEMYECGENGERQFECLIGILESGTIQPKELPDYGMDYGA